MTIELWGATTMRTFRPVWLAEELSLDYKLHPVGPRTGETQTGWFTTLTPKQKVPVLQYNGMNLTESLAICRYIAAKWGKGVIWQPETIEERAIEDEWCCYIYGELDETSLYVMRRHRDLPEIYGEAPKAVEASAEYASKHLKVIEGKLGEDEFLLKQFSLPDILLTTCLAWAKSYDIELPTRLNDYRNRMTERPAYRRAFDKNFRVT